MFKGMGRRLERLIPSVRIARRLRRLERRVEWIAHLGQGSSATYVGDGRVLVRVIAGAHAFIFYVDAADKLLSPWFIASGIYEPDLTRFLVDELAADSHCLDVGANFGYFTCLMAKHAPRGRTIGVEPDPEVHALAADNLILNALHEHGTVVNGAVGDAAGELTLYRRVSRSGNTSIAASGEGLTDALREPPEQPFTAAALRIDDLAERLDGRVDFIKIDIEGAEPLALRGAAGTITANPQLRIVMEWSPGQMRNAGFDVGDVVRDIGRQGLRPFVLSDGQPAAIGADALIGLGYQSGIVLRRGD